MSSFIGRVLALGTVVAVGVGLFFLGALIRILQAEFNSTEFFDELKKLSESSIDTILIAVAIILGITSLAGFYFSVLRTIRSTSERVEQEVASRFSIEEKALRRKIEAERDEKTKADLEEQALVLRREYESLLSENLQKKDGGFVTDWREVLLVARKRLAVEQQRLRSRNLVNLVLGITGLASGIVLLFYSLDSKDGLKEGYSFVDFLIKYWSRVGIVITIGVFAGFFLRLYALTERVIERNKSDLTNIELRLTAGLMLYDEKNTRNFAVLAKIIAQEDSKFILGKNESSGGVRTNKITELLSKLTPKIGD